MIEHSSNKASGVVSRSRLAIGALSILALIGLGLGHVEPGSAVEARALAPPVAGPAALAVQSMSADLAASLGLNDVRGALVSDVDSDGPAIHAGLRRGDVILEFNGTLVDDSNHLRNLVAESRPGSEATIRVWRSGQDRTLTATLAELAPTAAEPRDNHARANDMGLGMHLEPINPALRQRFDLPDGHSGLVVTAVAPTGQAATKGFQPGDLLEEIDGQPVGNAADVEAALTRHSDRPALVRVERQGRSLYLTLDRTS